MDRLKRLWSTRWFRMLAGASLGGVAGYLYYAAIGCPSGGCPITSNPYLMVPLGAFAGYSLFVEERKKNA